MPATSLRCRSCATEYALEDIGTCTACFGPLDPVYDWDELARTVSCETIAAGPPPSGATRHFFPSKRRQRHGSPPASRRS